MPGPTFFQALIGAMPNSTATPLTEKNTAVTIADVMEKYKDHTVSEMDLKSEAEGNSSPKNVVRAILYLALTIKDANNEMPLPHYRLTKHFGLLAASRAKTSTKRSPRGRKAQQRVLNEEHTLFKKSEHYSAYIKKSDELIVKHTQAHIDSYVIQQETSLDDSFLIRLYDLLMQFKDSTTMVSFLNSNTMFWSSLSQVELTLFTDVMNEKMSCKYKESGDNPESNWRELILGRMLYEKTKSHIEPRTKPLELHLYATDENWGKVAELTR